MDQQHDEKSRCHKAHYHDKAVERAHEERMAQVNAEQVKSTQAFEVKMVMLKLQQLDRELLLAKVWSGEDV